MKKYFKYLLIVSVIITLSFLVYMVFSNKHKDKYTSLKKTVSNTFFFLYNDKYENMDDISDNCKMSLLFDYNGFKSDKVIINEGGKKIHGYSKNNIATSLKKILGKDSSINFSLNNENLYNFMSDTECIYNSKVSDLSYDSTKQILYSDGKEHHNKTIVINWDSEYSNGDIIELKASALMIVENENDYTLYVDKDMNYPIGNYNTLKEAKDAALNNYFKSYKYEFKFYKENDNYIWKKFERNKTSSGIIVD